MHLLVIAAFIATASIDFICQPRFFLIAPLTDVLNPAETALQVTRLLKDFQCHFYTVGLLKGYLLFLTMFFICLMVFARS